MPNLYKKSVSVLIPVAVKTKRQLLDAYGNQMGKHGSLKDAVLYFSTMPKKSESNFGISISHKSAQLSTPLHYMVTVTALITDHTLFHPCALYAYHDMGIKNIDFEKMTDVDKLSIILSFTNKMISQYNLGIEFGDVVQVDKSPHPSEECSFS